jgi:phosphatidylinositol-4,5-bisphosphate 3-kinase
VANLYVRVFLFYGCKNVAEPKDSDVCEVSSDPRWQQWLIYKDLTVAGLPRGSRLGFILCGRKIAKPDKEIMLGWVVHQLIDDQGQLSRGKLSLRLWANASRKKGKHGKPREPDVTFLHRATTAQNLAEPLETVSTLTIQLDDFCLPVVAPVSEKFREPNPRVVGQEVALKTLSKDQQKQWDGLLACDILRELTSEDQILLWNMRHHLVTRPDALGKFLQCVDWGNVDKRMEAYRLLQLWSRPASAVTALELLDAKFADPVVRQYAIDLLRSLKDDQLRNYLLQLVQCLKFEVRESRIHMHIATHIRAYYPSRAHMFALSCVYCVCLCHFQPYHDSPLKRFLLERALAAPMNVGHYFFWHLKAEVHAPHCCERFGLILEEYLSFAGRFTTELRKQAAAVLRLQRVAEMVVRLKRDHGYSDPEAMKEYSKACEKLNRDFFQPMGKFQLPLDPKIEVTQLVVEKWYALRRIHEAQAKEPTLFPRACCVCRNALVGG